MGNKKRKKINNKSSQKLRWIIAYTLSTITIIIIILLRKGIIEYTFLSEIIEVSGIVLSMVSWLFPFEPINTSIKNAISSKNGYAKKDFSIIYHAEDRDWYRWFRDLVIQEGHTVRQCEWDGNENLNEVMEKENRMVRHTFSIVTSKFLEEAKQNPGYHDFKKLNCSRKLNKIFIFKERHELLCIHKGPLVELKGLSNELKLNLVNLTDRTEKVMGETLLTHISGTIVTNASIPPVFPGECKGNWEQFALQPYFTGREEILDKIDEMFQSGKNVVELRGLKGIGKTQIALAYMQRNHDLYRQVFLLQMSSDKIYEESLKEIGGILELAKTQNMHSAPQHTFMNKQMLQEAFMDWARNSHQRWLLILDDSDKLKVELFKSSIGKGRILWTTNQIVYGDKNFIAILPMEQQEGALFLLRHTGILTISQKFNQASKSHREEALEISQVLGNLPEALEIAGRYINYTHGERSTPIPSDDNCLKQYLRLYQDENSHLKEMYKDLCPKNGDEVVIYAWYISFEWLSKKAPEASEILLLCSLLGQSVIPNAIIEKSFQIAPICSRSISSSVLIDMNNMLGKLLKLSLVERENDGILINSHVQDFLSRSIESAKYKDLASYIIKATVQAFPEATINEIQQCKQYEPHVKACEKLIKKFHFENEDVAQLYNSYGNYLREMACYEKAEEYLTKSLNFYKTLSPVKKVQSAKNMSSLAELYYLQSRLDDAENLYQEALQIHQQQTSINSLDIALVSYSLAIVYKASHKNQEALNMYNMAVESWELLVTSEKEPQSFDGVHIRKKIAYLYYAEGKSILAIDMYKNILKICDEEEEKEKTSFPETDVCRANLARCYFDCQEKEKYEVAESQYIWALRLYKNIFGVDHPQVAMMYRNLADLHERLFLESSYSGRQKHYDEAISHYEKAREIYIQKLSTSPENIYICDKLYKLQNKNPFYQKRRERKQKM